MIRKILKVDSNNTCLAVITLDSAHKKGKNYYRQMFLRECKCINKKVIRHIDDNLSNFPPPGYSDDSDKK